jgi:hypothetical protein
MLIVRVAMNMPKLCGPSRREMTEVSLASNFEARYWMQALGVTRRQLDDAVGVVGTQVEAVMGYLRVPERRLVDGLRIVQARS